MCREKLKVSRKSLKLTQQQTAEKIGVSLRYYQKVESGEAIGSVKLWDALEDLLGVSQQSLRVISNNRPGKEASLSEH